MFGDIYGNYYIGDFRNYGRFAVLRLLYKVSKLTVKTVLMTLSIYFLR
jgi:hypothetical protein